MKFKSITLKYHKDWTNPIEVAKLAISMVFDNEMAELANQFGRGTSETIKNKMTMILVLHQALKSLNEEF